MRLFARWQHLDLDLDAIDGNLCRTGIAVRGRGCASSPQHRIFVAGKSNDHFGKSLSTSWSGLDIFQLGGVIFF